MSKEKKSESLTGTYGAGAITTDLKDSDLNKGEQTVDLSKATITVPESAITSEDVKTPEVKEVEDNSFARRALNAGIGKVSVIGVNFDYVGKSPQLDKGTTPGGLAITGENSTFTPLSEVLFDVSQRVKVGDKYFFPQDATSWEGVEGLVPKK